MFSTFALGFRSLLSHEGRGWAWTLNPEGVAGLRGHRSPRRRSRRLSCRGKHRHSFGESCWPSQSHHHSQDTPTPESFPSPSSSPMPSPKAPTQCRWHFPELSVDSCRVHPLRRLLGPAPCLAHCVALSPCVVALAGAGAVPWRPPAGAAVSTSACLLWRLPFSPAKPGLLAGPRGWPGSTAVLRDRLSAPPPPWPSWWGCGL